MPICRGCGARADNWESVCPYCGSAMPGAKTTHQGHARPAGPRPQRPEPLRMFQGGKSRWLSIALAFFAGFVGGHWFYLERWPRALLCVFFSWTLIPFFLGLRDGFRMLGMTEPDFRHYYG